MLLTALRRFAGSSVAAGAIVVTAACQGKDAPPASAAQAPPPSAVTIVTLEQKSLRSTTVQPEVEGLVTRIFVKSGDHVRAGAPLVQINAAKQQATVRSTEASRAGTEADVQYWRQQLKRLESLVGAGAISRQEFDQAQNSLRTAEARLAALDAQVREGRVELQYYRVDAPQAGVIGDIPIRTGDRVTTSTMITTGSRRTSRFRSTARRICGSGCPCSSSTARAR